MAARAWINWPLIMLGYDPGTQDTTAATVAAVAHYEDRTVVVIRSSNEVTATNTSTLTGDAFQALCSNVAREPLRLVAPPRPPGRYATLPPRPPPAPPLEPDQAIRVPRRLLHRRSHCC